MASLPQFLLCWSLINCIRSHFVSTKWDGVTTLLRLDFCSRGNDAVNMIADPKNCLIQLREKTDTFCFHCVFKEWEKIDSHVISISQAIATACKDFLCKNKTCVANFSPFSFLAATLTQPRTSGLHRRSNLSPWFPDARFCRGHATTSIWRTRFVQEEGIPAQKRRTCGIKRRSSTR